ncbi:MAG: hypothetical protein ACXIU7_13055 [Roseinatronobacter sp.]
MIVSQFELVYKPQSPVGPADVALQGYFLTITNLEDMDLRFRLRFTTSSVSDPDRSLFQNAAVLIDTPDVNNSGIFSLSGNLTSKSFLLRKLVDIPAHGTALVAVLPSDPFPPQLVPAANANFECRGFVTLTLPPNRLKPQAKAPVKVLLSAQNRTLYVTQQDDLPNGQSQASIPISTGQSLNEIVPESFRFDAATDLVLSDLPFKLSDELLSGSDLLAFLSEMGDADMDLRELNAALKEAGIGMAIERRKL